MYTRNYAIGKQTTRESNNLKANGPRSRYRNSVSVLPKHNSRYPCKSFVMIHPKTHTHTHTMKSNFAHQEISDDFCLD